MLFCMLFTLRHPEQYIEPSTARLPNAKRLDDLIVDQSPPADQCPLLVDVLHCSTRNRMESTVE